MSKCHLIALFSALLFASSACELGAVNWPEAIKCGPGISDLIGIVSEILLGESNVEHELEGLARTHGTDTVVCLVERLRTDWTSPGSAASPTRVRGVERADVFLSGIGTKFE